MHIISRKSKELCAPYIRATCTLLTPTNIPGKVKEVQREQDVIHDLIYNEAVCMAVRDKDVTTLSHLHLKCSTRKNAPHTAQALLTQTVVQHLQSQDGSSCQLMEPPTGRSIFSNTYSYTVKSSLGIVKAVCKDTGLSKEPGSDPGHQ